MFGRGVSCLIIVAVFIIWLYCWIPSCLEPVVWTNPSPLPQFREASAVNNLLERSRIEHGVVGPECIAFDETGEIAYISSGDGSVSSFNTSTFRFIKRVFFMGEYFQGTTKSNGREYINADALQRWCTEEFLLERLQWNTENERLCGRPLGLRHVVVGGVPKLYIMDAYHGLFVLDLSNPHNTQHLVSAGTPIENAAHFDEIARFPPLFFNDLDVLSDSSVVFTDSSYKFTRSENRQEILDGAPRGRIFVYNSTTGSLRLLMCGLHFPNGVQLMRRRNAQSTEVLVVELARFRILKINLTAPYFMRDNDDISMEKLISCNEDGTLTKLLSETENSDDITVQSSVAQNNNYERYGISIFANSIPGLGDNIRSDCFHTSSSNSVMSNAKSHDVETAAFSKVTEPYSGHGDATSCTYWVGMGGKSVQPFSLLWLSYQLYFLRILVGKLVPMRWVENLVPQYGLVVQFDSNGKIIHSLHDPTGSHLPLISHAVVNPRDGSMWLGSHSNNFFGILLNDDIFDSDTYRKTLPAAAVSNEQQYIDKVDL